MVKLTVKYLKGQEPEGQAAECMTEEDWGNHRKYVEECKKDGTYGTEQEAVLELKDDKFFDNSNKLVLDTANTELIKF